MVTVRRGKKAHVGEVRGRIQVEIVGLTALDYLKNVAGEQPSNRVAREADIGEIDEITGIEPVDRVRRHRESVDFQPAAGGAERDRAAAKRSAVLQLGRSAVDHDVASDRASSDNQRACALNGRALVERSLDDHTAGGGEGV